MSRSAVAAPRRPTILIAGGGTGGHVFPGLAVADALRVLAEVDVVFAGTPRGLEARLVPERGYPLELLDVEPMKGGGAHRAVRGAFVAARATVRALVIVKRLGPRVVVSVGGYAAGPVALAAAIRRVPLAVIEPNSVAGFANRMLAPFAKRAYVAWDETAKQFAAKARVTGVPLREGFVPRVHEPRGSARVLVLGGSQGASALNERVPLAVAVAAKKLPGLEVLHQTGADRVAEVRNAYSRAGVSRITVTPFIVDVASEIARADVVIARAGAVTVAEIAAIGRASILVPFPHAADDHQAKNALALERAGGAVCLRQDIADVTRLGHEIQRLLGDAPLREGMAAAARACGKPDAAERIAADILALAGIVLVARTAASPPRTNGKASHAEVR